MILNQFPNIQWLKSQIKSNFINQTAWDNTKLDTPGWPSVILNVKTTQAERLDVKGPFSLFMNNQGTSEIKADNRKIKINENACVISNSGQHYDLIINETKPTETFNIHFGEKLYKDSLKVFLGSDQHLLDDPFSLSFDYQIPIKTLFKTAQLDRLVKAVVNCDVKEKLLADEQWYELLNYLFVENTKKIIPAERFSDLKKATRTELLRRLLVAVDYMHVNFNQAITLDVLAEKSCLSKFHFSRSFKKAFGQSPYQYLKTLKINKALELYTAGNLTLQEIADIIGIENASSLSRLIFQKVGAYPSKLLARN